MIENIKNILNKLLNYPDIEFCSEFKYGCRTDGTEKSIYSITYKKGDSKFTISPGYFCNNVVQIYKDFQFIDNVKCSYEDYLEVLLLVNKLNKKYIDKLSNEFIHSLD